MPLIKQVNEQCQQSFWLDDLRRDWIQEGTLKKYIKDGISGVTSNPAIFEKALKQTNLYQEQIKNLKQKKYTSQEIYEHLIVKDVQDACDLLPNGYVSLEVSPHLAHDTQKTIEEAKRLYQWVNRSQLMIKVPATPEGILALEVLIAEGMNINMTLLFSVGVYEKVILAYERGLKKAHEKGLDINLIHSVASFFISRVDTAMDPILEQKKQKDLLGKVGIANALVAYEKWKIHHDRLKKGNSQRLLFASTGVKNPNYSDLLYVEGLMLPHTINTLPHPTLMAFLDHGKVQTSTFSYSQANSIVKVCEDDLNVQTNQLLKEGLELFSNSFDRLLLLA